MFGIAGCQSDESAPSDDDEQEQDEFGIGIAYHIGGTDDTVEFWSIAGSEDKVGEFTLAGASNGSINYSYGSESIDISVW